MNLGLSTSLFIKFASKCAGIEIILPSLIHTCIRIGLSLKYFFNLSYMHDGGTLEARVL